MSILQIIRAVLGDRPYPARHRAEPGDRLRFHNPSGDHESSGYATRVPDVDYADVERHLDEQPRRGYPVPFAD